jgi:hypothetical protein
MANRELRFVCFKLPNVKSPSLQLPVEMTGFISTLQMRIYHSHSTNQFNHSSKQRTIIFSILELYTYFWPSLSIFKIKKMKKYLFLLCGLFVFVISLSAQKQKRKVSTGIRNDNYIKIPNGLKAGDIIHAEFEKHDLNFLSNQDFNPDGNIGMFNHAAMLNNMFVKGKVCFNLDSISNINFLTCPFVVKGMKNQQDTIVVTQSETDSIIVTQDPRKHPVIINGVEYTRFFNVSVDKEITFVTLGEIKELYFPDVKEPYIFMVDKFFLTDDLQSYKFDKDFILKTELIESSEFEVLKNCPPFSILRIFTKVRKNLGMNAMRLR